MCRNAGRPGVRDVLGGRENLEPHSCRREGGEAVVCGVRETRQAVAEAGGAADAVGGGGHREVASLARRVLRSQQRNHARYTGKFR